MSDIYTLDTQEKLAWLRLIRSENVGTRTFHQLLSLYKTAARALEAVPELSRKGGRKKPIVLCSEAKAREELKRIEAFGATCIAMCEPAYPSLLRQLRDAPPVIIVKGNAALLQQPMIAMVGARNASLNSCRFAEKISSDLAHAGYVVASGLARGIDAAAHRGALEKGTVGVIAGGINHIYPKENKGLFEAMYEKGVVVAELAFGSAPQAKHFPQRNRIISGMSLGTLIVEATLGSGSLITARMAIEQDREVFAIPGSPIDPRCRGTNKLLKDGAHLVESAQDVIDVLAMLQHPKQHSLYDCSTQNFITAELACPDEEDVASARGSIIEALGAAPVGVDDIIHGTGISAHIVQTILLELELAGRLERQYGNKVSLLMAYA